MISMTAGVEEISPGKKRDPENRLNEILILRGRMTGSRSNEIYLNNNLLWKRCPWDSRVAWSILERLGRLDRGSNPRYPINYFLLCSYSILFLFRLSIFSNFIPYSITMNLVQSLHIFILGIFNSNIKSRHIYIVSNFI